MASPYNNSQYQQNMGNMQPINTQNPQQHPPPQHQPYPQQHQQQQPPVSRPFSPPSHQVYHQSPAAMSPTMGGIPPAKRQRMNEVPPSPYTSPFNASHGSPYAPMPPGQSPYPPPTNQYMSRPQSPASPYPMQSSFNQPQPYQQNNQMNLQPPPPQSSMPPPKVPASKTQDGELEKSNPRDMDVNNISDVLTGSGIDLRAEEEYLTHSFGNRNQDNSFYSTQGSGATMSPHASFNNWTQGASGHGAFQGSGLLSQPMSQEEQEAELRRKHDRAARALAETAAAPLSDPFLLSGNVRYKIATRAYHNGIHVNLEGVFDKIPDANTPQNVRRATVGPGANGDSIVSLQADSLLNHNAPFVDLLSLMTLAAEERCRTILEDAFALAQSRQHTADGVVPPSLADLATANGDAKSTTAVPTNLSKTAWEDPNSNNVARLPTPPTEPPPTPQPTIQFTNPIANALKKRVLDDYSFEKARIAKRQKRLQGNTAAAADAPIAVPIIPEKMSKKEREKLNKVNTSDDALHRQANKTASLALGGKKKYSWMSGGGGGGGGSALGSRASTPRPGAAVAGASGASTPAQPQIDRGLVGGRRTYGGQIDPAAKRIQLRDLIHTLDVDGHHKRTLAALLTKPKNTDKEKDDVPGATPTSAR